MNLKKYFKKAQKEKWAIGQFNFSTLEQLRGIFSAGKRMQSPIILGTSEGECNYLGFEEILALFEITKMKYGIKEVFLNLDHGKSFELVKRAIDFGYSLVHFDGSFLSFEENIKQTKKVVEYAHRKGVLVEGELGYIEGESRAFLTKTNIQEKNLTDPEQIKEFVRKTKVDCLAISIRNIHGIYKKMPKLDFERLKEIKEKTNVFLVLHGGSGIPRKEIKKAIKLGIVKININTELRIVWKNSFKRKGIKPYEILPYTIKSVQKKVEDKIKLFGSKNKLL